jgi:hypothetical protein
LPLAVTKWHRYQLFGRNYQERRRLRVHLKSIAKGNPAARPKGGCDVQEDLDSPRLPLPSRPYRRRRPWLVSDKLPISETANDDAHPQRANKRGAFAAKLKLGQLKGRAAINKYAAELIG